jgi:DNA end-binding protein Ku
MGMSTMLFADEVVDPSRLDELDAVREVAVDERELEIAKQLVGSLAADFDPARYTDSYRARVLDLIERKAAGEEISVQIGPKDEAAPVPDLMAALKASLDAARGADGKAVAKPAARKSAARKPAAGKPKRAPSAPSRGRP